MAFLHGRTLLGSGDYIYEIVQGFGAEWITADAAGVTVDSQDRVYILIRSDKHPVLVFTSEGELLRTWGAGRFRRAHAIFAGPDDSIYCVDDRGHAMRKFTPDGDLLCEIDTSDRPADTGYIPVKLDSVARAGPPFNNPTGVALSPEGDIVVSDGYGNARIHRFTADGEFISSFGEPGHGPGQFFLPHGVAIDAEGRIYVADRENSRVQIFTPDGSLLSQWRSPRASCLWIEGDILFVTEMGEVMQGEPGKKYLVPQNAAPRVTVRNRDGDVIAELPAVDPDGDGLFFAPHSIARDSSGNLYVSEVSDSYSGGLAPKDRPRVSKYVLQAGPQPRVQSSIQKRGDLDMSTEKEKQSEDITHWSDVKIDELPRDLRFHPSTTTNPTVLSRDQIEAFNRDGFIKGIRVFSDTEADDIRSYFDRLLASVVAEGGDSYSIVSAHMAYGRAYELLTEPRIVACVCDLMGDNIVGWGSNFICKIPHDGKRVSWHQDASYWPLKPSKTVSVWLAIDDVDIENAAMRVIPGSHHHGALTWQLSEQDEQNVLFQTVPEAERFGDPVDVELKAGEISLHSDLLLHGSEPNDSVRRRCGLAMRYCSADVRAGEGWNGKGVLVSGDDPGGHWANRPRPECD